MNVTFRRAFTFACAIVLAAVIAGCASPGPLAKAQADLPKSKVDARGLFQENCIRCHGVDGRAHTFHGIVLDAQNLSSNTWQLDTSDEDIMDAISNGPGAMPAFGKKLSTAEIQALAGYVRTLKIGE